MPILNIKALSPIYISINFLPADIKIFKNTQKPITAINIGIIKYKENCFEINLRI